MRIDYYEHGAFAFDDEPPPDPEADSAEELEEMGYYDEDAD